MTLDGLVIVFANYALQYIVLCVIQKSMHQCEYASVCNIEISAKMGWGVVHVIVDVLANIDAPMYVCKCA